MSIRDSSQTQPGFDRRSDMESVCNSCFTTIKADRYMPIEVAEDIHMDLCLLRRDLPVDFLLW